MSCIPSSLKVSVAIVSPIGMSNVSAQWQNPQGPCERLSYDVLVDGHPILTNIPGCNPSATLLLERSCNAYEFKVLSYFILADGTRGPACLNTSLPVSMYVNNPPLPPSSLAVNIPKTSLIEVVWKPSLDPGGCFPFNYLLALEEIERGIIIFSDSYQSSTLRTTINISLHPALTYRIYVSTMSPAGNSANISRDFMGTLQQTCFDKTRSEESQVHKSTARGAPFCELSGSCTGFNSEFLPQFLLTCACAGNTASFWMWNLTIPSEVQTTVNYSIAFEGQPVLTNTTRSSIVTVSALPSSISASSWYSVAYNNDAALFPPKYIQFAGA